MTAAVLLVALFALPAIAGRGLGIPAAGAQMVGPAGLPRIDRPVQPELLEPNPMKGWGVTGYQEQTGVVNKSLVWDFAQVGDRLFVAGSFTGVQQNFYGNQTPPPINSQRFLAAFDVDTNQWIDTFRPTFDAPILSMVATPDGKLLLGGGFTTVNGTTRRGLVKLDPLTGQVDPTFAATVAQDGSSFPYLVRELAVSGDSVYLAGDFNRVVFGAERNGVYSVARVRWLDGAFDYGWRPRPTGEGVNDVEPDPARNRVHLAGNFTAVNGSPGTAYQAVVSMTDGSTVSNVFAFQNDSAQYWEFGVALNGDKVWTAGAQHQVQVLNADTRGLIDWYRAGTSGTTFNGDGLSYYSGGDMQVIEAIDSFVAAGCHCLKQNYGGIDLNRLLYWSGGNQFSPHAFALLFDAATRRPLNFFPNLVGNYYGTWAIGSDTNGCLYVGGDYNTAGSGLRLGGYARFCRPATAPTALAARQNGSAISLSWSPPDAAGSGVSRYRVSRDGVFLGETTGLTYADGNVVAGRTYNYAVSVVSTDSRVGPAAAVSAAWTPDVAAPTTPANVQLTTNFLDTVALTWDVSTDNVGVTGYLVHRDFQFLAWVPAGTTYVDRNVVTGQTYRYEVRAQDAAGNNSAPSPIRQIAVRLPDVTPPSPPVNPAAVTNGVDAVTLAWDPATDDVGVTGYLVHRDFQFLAWVPVGTSYTDRNVVAGQTYRYEVRAQDAAGNTSASSAPGPITVTPGGLDTIPPTEPNNATAVYDPVRGVIVGWSASTDNDRVKGYLVHRNGVFLAYLSAGTTYTDTSAGRGQRYRYEIRAQDASGNNSAPSVPATVDVP